MNSVLYCMNNLSQFSKLRRMDKFTQHGDTTCLKHTIAVAYYSIKLAEMMGIQYKRRDLIRGALLHDYFLYDWHEKRSGKNMHGFTHPTAAMNNADRDFSLTEVEKDIIKKHMFPLTVKPPMCREGWIVCVVDKLCSVYETFKRKNAYTSGEGQRKYSEILLEEIQTI